MSNEYKPTYVDNTDNSISIMESTDTISFCKTGAKINTLSAKNVAHKKTGEDLNLCAFNNSNFNPVMTINNNHSDCRIMTNLNVNGNLNITKNLIIPTHSETSTLLANVQGSIYYNTSENMYEGYSQTEGWQPLGGFSKTKDATIHKNLNVIGNINLTNEGMIKTTGIGSFGSITTTGSITSTTGSITTNNQNINAGSGTVTANTFSGTVDRATAADKVQISNTPGSSNFGYYLSMFDSHPSTAGDAALFGNSSLHYNPYSNTLTGGTFNGSVPAANVTGSVSAADTANGVQIKSGSSYGNADRYILFNSEASSSGAVVMADDGIRYNPHYEELIVGGTGGFPSAGSRARVSIEGISLSSFTGQESGLTSVVIRNGSTSDSSSGPGGYHGDYSASAYTMGIDCAGGIWLRGVAGNANDGTNRLFISSDRRIKTDIEEVNDNKALINIRNIKSYYYSYISTNKLRRHIGFIAQEVFKYLPESITLRKEFLPNVMKLFKKTDLKEVNINNDIKYNLSSNEFTNINGIRYKFYVSNKIDGSDEKCLAITGNNDNTFTFDSQYNYIFCYGKEVDDFHILNESYIYTLHHSAIQEIDRQQIADKERITNLETQVNTLESANQQQQTKIDTLETEISTLKTENTELKSIINKLKTANSFEEFKQTF
jgi:hypothetical protein